MNTTLDRRSTDDADATSRDKSTLGRGVLGLGGTSGTTYDCGRSSRRQMLEALQPRRVMPSAPGLLVRDPYGPSSSGRSRWGDPEPRDTSDANDAPRQGYPVRLWGSGEARVIPAPKIVASFVGKVESLGDEVAIVTLVNAATGERLESQCDTEVLREKGINSGDEFRCEVVRSGGETMTRLVRLLPKPLSEERVAEIRASYSDRWDF